MGDVRRPDWWAYPTECQHGHPWGPGRVLVGWSPCDCAPARAERPRGPGHLTVLCRTEGCTSVWYKPRHDKASRTWGAGSGLSGLTCRTRATPARRSPAGVGAAAPRQRPRPHIGDSRCSRRRPGGRDRAGRFSAEGPATGARPSPCPSRAVDAVLHGTPATARGAPGGGVVRAAPCPPGASVDDLPAVLPQTISFASVAIGPPMALFCADRGGGGRGVAGAGGLRCGGRGGRVAPPTSPARGRPADGFKPGPPRLARAA